MVVAADQVKVSYISTLTPSITISTSSSFISPLVLACTLPKKSSLKPSLHHLLLHRLISPSFWLSLITGCVLLSVLKFAFLWHPSLNNLDDSCVRTLLVRPYKPAAGVGPSSNANAASLKAPDFSSSSSTLDEKSDFVAPFRTHSLEVNMSAAEKQFWQQPGDHNFKPCLKFSSLYQADTKKIAHRKRKYLLVIVSGGLNQQRNEIVDAVVIARILEASLVIPILQVNQIWKDDSEFSDIFDAEHFKEVLKNDVHIVSSLPSTHLMGRPVQESSTPLSASPQWFRDHYMKRFSREGVLLLRGMEGRLSKDLPPDLQKLRCKVAFHALRFTAPIMEIGNRLARRMWEKGSYVALHLRLEKDVWVRTGCLPGLGYEYDQVVLQERENNPRLLTARSNMTFTERKLVGLCPLNAAEVARLLKALGAGKNTRIFWAGGEPLGGGLALKPLVAEFGPLYDKNSLALPGELERFANKASILAAIDYLICLHSDIFMPSHGGNMARALQGHRAYAGYRKYITPNKREILHYFLNASFLVKHDADMDLVIRNLHKDQSLGQPAFRTDKKGRDVLAYPAPECMCARTRS